MAKNKINPDAAGSDRRAAAPQEPAWGGRSSPTAACPAPSGKAFFLICGLLFVLVALVFLPSIRNQFLYWYGDDPLYVTENLHVNTGLTWENIQWAFFGAGQSNWHPLTWISHMLDCTVYGLKPWGHHLTSVLIHAANSVLLFVVLRKLTSATWRSLAVALLFGLHPLRVESVAWVAERKDVLCAFFWMLTTWFYVRYVQSSKSSDAENIRRSTFDVRCSMFSYSLALFCFALALLSKSMAVTLPFVLLLLDYWPLRREWKTKWPRLVGEKVPFLLLVAAASALTYRTEKNWGFVQGLSQYSPSVRLENSLVSYGRYLGKLFWPTDLSSYYQHPGHWPLTTIVIAGVLLLGISTLAMATIRTRPYFAVGWCWYVGTLVPVIGLVQLGDQAMADRYTYIPTIGILLLLVWGLHDLTAHWRQQARIALAVAASISVTCIALTIQQIGYFADSVTLWRHAVAVTQKNGWASYALALSLDKQGRPEDAIRELQGILQAKPEWADAHCNLGTILCRQGRLDEGISAFEAALKVNPNLAEAHNALGLALARKGQLDDASTHFQMAIQLSPHLAQAHDSYGRILEQQGHLDEAILEFQKAVDNRPGYAHALNDLGAALFKKGRTNDAVACFEQALKFQPDYANARRNLDVIQGDKSTPAPDQQPHSPP